MTDPLLYIYGYQIGIKRGMLIGGLIGSGIIMVLWGILH